MFDSAAIQSSLEAVLARVPDPVPLVYERLYADYPETVALFFLDRDGRRREHMLSVTFETLLDFIGAKHFSVNMLHCERINHAELGVPPEISTRFFWVVRDAFRDELGADWSPAYETAWAALLDELEGVVHA